MAFNNKVNGFISLTKVILIFLGEYCVSGYLVRKTCKGDISSEPLILQEASLAIPLFSPVLVPMAQSLGPLLSQVATSPTVRLGVRF